MQEKSVDPERRKIDLFAVSGARALKRAGWSETMIADAYGGLPPIHMTVAEILAHNAGITETGKSRGFAGRRRPPGRPLSQNAPSSPATPAASPA